MNGIKDDAIFSEDGDDDGHLKTEDIHSDVSIKESDFKEFLKHFDNDLLRWIIIDNFCIVKE